MITNGIHVVKKILFRVQNAILLLGTKKEVLKRMTLPKDPLLREECIKRMSERTKLQFSDPNQRKMASESHKKTFENPEQRRLNRERNKIRCANPIVRQQMSESHIGKKLSEEQKIKIGDGVKKHYEDFPEDRVKKSVFFKKLFENPNKRRKVDGSNNPNYGKKASEITIKKLSLSHTGKIGNRASNWKGGITPLLFQIRNCVKMSEWKKSVFERDCYICQTSGKKGGNLEAHHKIKFSTLLKKHDIKTLEEAINCEDLWDISNGITLEKKEHRLLHKRTTTASGIEKPAGVSKGV